MALVLKDRVKELTATTGTGAVTLDGPIAGFQGFSSIGNGNLTYYTIVDTNTGSWEVGYGTYTASGSTLSRTFVYASSNADTLVDFGAGSKEVFVTYPAEQAIYQETNGSLKLVGGTIGLTQDGTEGTTLPNTSFQAFTTGDYYMQANQQNLSSGAEASSDWVSTADNGTDTENYMDMGMASSGYNTPEFSAFKANSGYILSTGSDLRIVAGKYGAATPGAQDIVMVAGTLLDTEERLRIKGLTGNVIIDGINPTDTGEKLQVIGSTKFTGASAFGSTVLLSANPTLALQAATKQYVDNQVTAGLHIHAPVLVETTANLTAGYTQGGTTFDITDITTGNTVTTSVTHSLAINDQIWLYTTAGNGLSTNTAYFVYSTPAANQLTLSLTFGGSQITGLTNATGLTYNTRANSGVGALLTNSGTQAALTIDNVALVVGNRVMVRLQTTGAQNGVYEVTDIGSISTNWVLERATDSDKVNPADPNGVGTGDYYFTQDGDLNAGDSHVLTTEPNTMIIGYTSLTYTQFSGSVDYTGGTNIDVTGQIISLTGVVDPSNGGTGISSYTNGDTIYASGAATFSKLPIGTTGQTMIVAGGFPAWGALNMAGTGVSGVLPATKGGTNQSSYAIGDLLYSSATNTLSKLAGNITTTKKYLAQTGTGSVSAAPTWGAIAAADVSGLAASATTDTTNAANITTGALPSGRLIGGYTGITAVGTLAGLNVSDSTVIAATSTADALRITQTGTGNALLVEDSGSPDSTPVVITSAGYLVVGYTDNIPATFGNTKFIQSHSVGGTAGYTAARWDATANGPQLLFGKSRGGAVGTFGIVAADDMLGQIGFSGDDGVDLVTSGALITAYVDGTPGLNDMPGRLVFSTTADGNSSPTERMRINSAGNVGIGNTAITNIKLRLGGDITGSTTAYGVYTGLDVQPDVTGRAIMYVSAPTTAIGTTPTALTHYYATQSTFSGTPTAQYGFEVTSSLIGATNNYGFYSNISAGTGRYNFYANGTAANYFAGVVSTGSTISDVSGDVRSIPQNAKTAAYVLVATDNGKHISITTGGVTVPASVFAIGNAVTIFNNSATAQTITQGASTTLYNAGDGTSGNRTLGARGMATVLCVATNTFAITGAGLT